MYLRCNRRLKDGKEHCYWNIVESKRCAGGKVVQRQVLYLGEINDSQHEAWCRVIEAFDEQSQPLAPNATAEPAAFGTVPESGASGITAQAEAPATNFFFRLNRKRLRQVRRREGRYLLRTNLRGRNPDQLWQFYIQLTEIEAAFKNLKDDLQLRPIYHQLESRIEAHIFIAFMAYCLQVTLRARLKPLAGGLTPRAVLDKLAGIQMLDVHFPTTDGRTLILSRYTEPNADQKILLDRLNLTLPSQPPPRITATGRLIDDANKPNVVETFRP
jgi:hypothetical protein